MEKADDSAPLLTTASPFEGYIPLITTQHLAWSIFMGLFRGSLTEPSVRL